MSIRCVQADHNSCGCDTDHPVPESHLLRAIEGDEAGYFRFQKADRLSGMDDLVRYRLRDRLLGRKTDLLLLELTPGPASKTPRAHPSCRMRGRGLPVIHIRRRSQQLLGQTSGIDVLRNALEAAEAEPTCARLACIQEPARPEARDAVCTLSPRGISCRHEQNSIARIACIWMSPKARRRRSDGGHAEGRRRRLSSALTGKSGVPPIRPYRDRTRTSLTMNSSHSQLINQHRRFTLFVPFY
jgi:hypothetical protein